MASFWHLLVSRFESSVYAFKASLDYMIKSSVNILKWIGKRHAIPVFKKGNLPMWTIFITLKMMVKKYRICLTNTEAKRFL